MLERRDVELIGDAPSNRFFSTYTDICNLLTRIENFPNSIRELSNYYTPGEEQLITKLKAKIDEFKRSPHSHATSSGAQLKKQKEIKAVNDLETSMQNDLLYAQISKVLNDNAESPIALVRNSVAGWKRKFQRGSVIRIVNLPGTNAQWSGNALEINPTAFFRPLLTVPPFPPEPFPISVLVHEYHHALTSRVPPLYEDEFVAHWKQYVVGRVPPLDDVGRAKRINNFLLRDPRGYIQFIKVPPKKELTLPQDVTWNATIDNLG
jgi:hypothetical protein